LNKKRGKKAGRLGKNKRKCQGSTVGGSGHKPKNKRIKVTGVGDLICRGGKKEDRLAKKIESANAKKTIAWLSTKTKKKKKQKKKKGANVSEKKKKT